jgi:ribonuclease E
MSPFDLQDDVDDDNLDEDEDIDEDDEDSSDDEDENDEEDDVETWQVAIDGSRG